MTPGASSIQHTLEIILSLSEQKQTHRAAVGALLSQAAANT